MPHRRRQSTIVYPTSSSSILDHPSPRTDTADTVPENHSSSASTTLKPPASTNNGHRSSFGLWGGSKAAASTPNLGNINKSSELLEAPALLSHGSTSSVPSLGSTHLNNDERSTINPNGLSFQQRRKRSESISGLKVNNFPTSDDLNLCHLLQLASTNTTAGNISRIVRKSSSSFLRKLVKNFDDKDAPPTPSIPTVNSSNSNNFNGVASQANSQHSTSTSSVNVPLPLPSLPALPAPTRAHGVGPLDGPSRPTITSTPNPDLDHQKLTLAATNVENWQTLENNSIQEPGKNGVTPSSQSTTQTSSADTTATSATTPILVSRRASEPETPSSTMDSSFSASQKLRRPSRNSLASTTDDGSDEEEENLPHAVQAIGTNRISRLYEAESMQQHLDQSQTSLYYSTKSTLSDENGVEAKAPAGTSFGNHARNSIRFSEYGIITSKDLPLAPPGIGTTLGAESELDKPLPRRPASMLIPAGYSASATTDDRNRLVQRSDSDPAIPTTATTTSELSLLSVHPSLIFINDVPEIPRTLNVLSPLTAGTRPATICVSADDATRIPMNRPGEIERAPTSDLSQAAQRAAMESLAIETSVRCYKEDDTFLKREDISCYLGAAKPFNRLVLTFYMSHFDFSGRRLDQAFRQLCHKLILKGETQEVDRILEAFAQRFVDCNPESIFGSKDVVHAISYSILLLNTDLHVVQQSSSSKMSRSAFVKNTLQVVQAQTQYQIDSRPSEDSSGHGLTLTRTLTGEQSVNGSLLGSNLSNGNGQATLSTKKRTPSVKSWKSGASFQSKSSKMGTDPKANGGHGNGKYWMSELESLLKDIYSTVKNNQILLPTSSAHQNQRHTQSSQPNSPTLSIFPHHSSGVHVNGASGSARSGSGGFLPRLSRQVQPSALTDAGYHVGSGGLVSNLNSVTPKISMVRRNSINSRTKQLRLDAIQRLTAQSTEDSAKGIPNHRFSVAGNGHSLPNRNSALETDEPTSPGNHRHSTQETMDHSPIHKHSAQNSGVASPIRPGEASAVHPRGAHLPRYRMEGILFRKHLLERADKKASHRAWRQLLVVLDQAGLSMFRADGQMGQAFEEQGILFDEIRLQHTITNILPPPGYSASRRHVFAIQLHTGAVFLFQTATAKECEEWARTCNYWAARTSKEPLPGGVINMDYGWGRSLDMLANQQQQQQQSGLQLLHLEGGSSTSVLNSSANDSGTNLAALSNTTSETQLPALISSTMSDDGGEDNRSIRTNNSFNTGTSYLNYPPAAASPPQKPTGTLTPSTTSGSLTASSPYSFGNSGAGSGRSASIKSTTSSKYGGSGSSSNTVPLGDRVMLFEWTPPLPTMSMATLTEADQCEALKRFGSGLEFEMETHQMHRGPMTELFLPKSHNYAKAFNNWERRSRHLLKEMVKYQIYIECLEQSLRHQQEEQEQTQLGQSSHEQDMTAPTKTNRDLLPPGQLAVKVITVEIEETALHDEDDLQHLDVDDDEL
ncbi:hypothetical protein BGZ83_012179 [Gryganskiella cystojenkinii]|nr:hypothetical protein BGZ83_012179 [Gryganskiella cystojenkinii]